VLEKMRLKCDFEVMELNEEKIAVPVGDNASIFQGVVKLNETAAFILNLLKQETSEEAIVEALLSEYDADRETIENDVKEYISKFADMGLITS